MREFFEKVIKKLKLGELISEPSQVTGGLTHRMFKVETTSGKYIIKLLNPNIMKRPTAMGNFNRADELEEILKKNNINAIFSNVIDGKKMQNVDGQFLYVYDWFDGKSLKDNEITTFHCEKIGKALSDIHNIDLKNEEFKDDEKHIDWEFYIDKAKLENKEVFNMIYDKLDILNESMNKGNEAIKNMPNVISICHNDMDSKNVMWLNDEYKIIDLECLGYFNPYLELFELALCWSGYEKCDIDFNKFKTFMNSYFENSKLDRNINWEVLYYFNNGRLGWLEYNLKRALRIECSSEEEYEIGMNEVKETIEHVVYYDKVKNDILKNI